MLWLMGISLTTMAPLIYFTAGEIQRLIAYLFALVVISGIGVYLYFCFRDPDRLQSEEHIAEMRRISLLGESGKAPPTIDLRAEQSPNIIVEGEGADKNGG